MSEKSRSIGGLHSWRSSGISSRRHHGPLARPQGPRERNASLVCELLGFICLTRADHLPCRSNRCRLLVNAARPHSSTSRVPTTRCGWCDLEIVSINPKPFAQAGNHPAFSTAPTGKHRPHRSQLSHRSAGYSALIAGRGRPARHALRPVDSGLRRKRLLMPPRRRYEGCLSGSAGSGALRRPLPVNDGDDPRTRFRLETNTVGNPPLLPRL
jgi:hypothetical protein